MDKSCKTPRWRLLKAQLNNLSPEAFHEKIQQADASAVLIDVRTPEEFATGHLPGAVNINYFAEDFWDRLEALHPEQSLLVYCRTGRRSIRACTLLRNGGFQSDRIFNLDGGIVEWQEVFAP